jgi:hypothetical protein
MDIKEYKHIRAKIRDKYYSDLVNLRKQYFLESGRWGARKSGILPYVIRAIVNEFAHDKEFTIQNIRKRIHILFPQFKKEPKSEALTQALHRLKNRLIEETGRYDGRMVIYRIIREKKK